MKIRSFFLLILSLLLIAGISIHIFGPTTYSEKDLLWDGTIAPPPAYITKAQAKQDINLIIYALEQGHGGKYFISKELYEQVRKKLRNIPINERIRTEIFCQKVREILSLIPDGHLRAVIPRKKMGTRQRKKIPISVGQNRNTTQLPYSIELYTHGSHKILVIGITHYPPFLSKQWRGFLDKFKKMCFQDGIKGLILDLRGNRGGDSQMATELAKQLCGSNGFPYPVKNIHIRNTPEAYIMHANQVKGTILRMMKENDYVLEEQKYYDELLKKAAQAKQNNAPAYITRQPIQCQNAIKKEEVAFKKSITILMDRQCSSSGEIQVLMLAGHPYCQKIGENTAGVFHFGNMGFTVLPYSRIAITMGTQFSECKDGYFIERIGVAPDMHVQKGNDAFEVALKMMSKQH